MIYTDRSRTVARKECARMGWLQYDADGTGWVPKDPSLPLITGIILHAAFANLLLGMSLDATISCMKKQYAVDLGKYEGEKNLQMEWLIAEQLFMAEVIVRAWNHVHLPRILSEFTIATFPTKGHYAFVEQEFDVEIAKGVKAMLRMDAVLRRKYTNQLVIWDFKTAGYVSDDWMQKWQHNPQTYLYPHALEQFMQEDVEGIVYQGVVKGLRRTETANVPWKGLRVQTSPCCYGYKGPDGEYQLDYTSKKGWRKIAAFKEMTAEEWFNQVILPAHWDNNLLTNLFPNTMPVSPVKWEVERWVKQTAWAEYLNQTYKEEILFAKQRGDEVEARRLVDIYFPTNEERCFKYGAENKCPYIPVCFTQEPEMEALEFVRRTPHHDTEKEMV